MRRNAKQMDIEEVIENIDKRQLQRLENFLASEECSSLCMDDEQDRKQLAKLLQEADWV